MIIVLSVKTSIQLNYLKNENINILTKILNYISNYYVAYRKLLNTVYFSLKVFEYDEDILHPSAVRIVCRCLHPGKEFRKARKMLGTLCLQ